jgi:serine/threonine protein kinase
MSGVTGGIAMTKRLTCEHGHQWEVSTEMDVFAVLEGAVCPDCGAVARTLGPETPTQFPIREVAAGPHVVPGYEVQEELGRGGMGVVYRAWHVKLKRLVALKMVQAGSTARVQELTRFRAEAEAGARLQHPNIVQVFDVGEACDPGGHPCPYLALEYVDGGSLAQQLAGAPQPAGEAATLVETLARAMHYAHEQGVIHRDLKPANVLLAFSGRSESGAGQASAALLSERPLNEAIPKITDFGLAKQLDGDTGQTQSGAVLGTPSYMAPEQSGGPCESVGPRTDVYGLGAILYEMLTGRPPFRGTSVVETLEQVRHQEPVPPRRLQPKVPRDLETITLKCLEKDPARRYGSALDLADDLLRFRKGEPTRARPAGAVERLGRWCRRNPAVAGLAGALAATLVVGNVVAIGLYRNAEYQRRLAMQNLHDASQAVHDHFVTLSETHLANEPGTQALQKQLREAALAYFTRFAEQNHDDPALQWQAAEAYYWVAANNRDLGATDRALEAVQEAVARFERLGRANPKDVLTQRFLGNSYNLRGVLESSMGRFEAALQSYQRARMVRDEVAAVHPEAVALQRDAAATRHNLGLLRYRMHHSTEALAAYQDALELFENLASGRRNDANLQRDLALCHSNLGVLYLEQLDRSAEALHAQQQALAVRQGLAQAYPAVREYQEDLAASHNNLGRVYQEMGGHLEEARQAFQEALTLRERLARANQDAVTPQVNLADTYTNLGGVQARTGRAADALHSLGLALAVRKRLAQSDKTNLLLQRAWATAWHNLGTLHDDLGQKDDAIRCHQQALAMRSQLAQEHPSDPNLPGEIHVSQCELGKLQEKPAPRD